MNTLLALCAFVLSLVGVDFGGGTFVHHLRQGDAEILYSRVVVQAGVGHFECLRSASGRCHYTVYPRGCGNPAACGLHPLKRFTLDSGNSRQVPGLAHVHLCVGTGGPAPLCAPGSADRGHAPDRI